MQTIPIFAHTPSLHVKNIEESAIGFLIFLQSTAAVADCPVCQHPSNRIHSRYERHLNDLPCFGQPCQIQLEVRRFVCENQACSRKIFAERLPDVAVAYARTTQRLYQTQNELGRALGGEPGCRLAQILGMPCSADTLLRRVRSSCPPAEANPRILGVDDWAFRRGQRYGTILCDLEQRCVVDLLPDRSAESLETWLKAQPQVEIISRDRGGDYAKGAKHGAPQAVQVADRWHLLKNAREALQKVIERNLRFVRQAAQSLAEEQNAARETVVEALISPSLADEAAPRLSRSSVRRKRRLAIYQQIVAMDQQQVPLREIARRLQVGRRTVRRYLRSGAFPERAARETRSQIDPYREHLKRRWQDGTTNAVELWQELKANGFRGSYDVVRREVASWRKDASPKPELKSKRALPRPTTLPSARRISWLLWEPPEELNADDQRLVEKLKQCSEIVTATDLIGDVRRQAVFRFSDN